MLLEQFVDSSRLASGTSKPLVWPTSCKRKSLRNLPTREFVELVSERDKNSVIRWVVALFFAQLLGQTSLILIIGNMLWGS
jgi:hypothetical protein